VKVTNGDIWAATSPQDPEGKEQPPLSLLLSERWPVKTAYWLARLARKLGGPKNDISQVREQLIKEHGKTRDDGQVGISGMDDTWPAFVAAYGELMAQEVEVDIDKIVLPDVDGVEIKPTTLMMLEAFIGVTE
jgi:hypothetical protein